MSRIIIATAATFAIVGCDTRTSPSRPDVDSNGNDNDTVNTISPPNDPTLSALNVDPGSLAPAFSATTTRYTATVPQGTGSVTVSATPTNSGATLTIQGDARSAGESVSVPVAGPTTAIVFEVTSADASARRAYRLTVRVENDGSVNNNNNNGGMTLPAPSGFRVSAVSTNSVSLAWDLLAEATNYTLSRDDSPTGTFNTVVGSTTNTVFTDLNLQPATTYYYRLQATSSSAAGILTEPVMGTTQEVARIELGGVRCTGGPIYTDTDTTVQLEVDVDVRRPDASRASMDAVTIDLRQFGRTAFDPMALTSGATWSIDLTIPSATPVGTYTFPVAVEWMGLSESFDEGPVCAVEVRPINDDIAITSPLLTPNGFLAGTPQNLVLTAELTLTGSPTVDAFTADFSAVGGPAMVPMLDDGMGDDATVGDGSFTASFTAPGTVTTGSYDIVVNVAGTGSAGMISDSTTLPLTVNDAPALILTNPQVNPTAVSNNINAMRDVTISVTASTVGGATIDANGITANLSSIDPALIAPVPFTEGTPGEYSYVLAVPAGTTPDDYAFTINGSADAGAVTDSIVAPTLTVDGVYLDPAIAFDSITDTGTLETLNPGPTAGTVALTSPFDIQFYGTTVAAASTFTAATNGTLGIGTTGVDLGAQAPTDAAGYLAAAAGVAAPLLAAFHHDPMVADTAVTTPAQGIYTEVMGTPGSQMWIIEWFLASDATLGGSVQVQVVFYEDAVAAGADFEVRFGTMNVLSADPDNYSVVGVRNATLNDDVVLPQTTDPATLSDTAYVVSY